MKIPNKAIIEFEYSDENREYIFDIKELYDIIKEKQSRINKAIEYIEKEFDEVGCCVSGSDLPYSYIEELLDILKGSDKE